MQKSLSVKKKKRILNDLIMKLDKPSSIGRTSASGRPRSSRTHENTEVVSFAEQVDQPVDEKIYWSFCWRSACSITSFARKQLFISCIKRFFNRSHDALITDTCSRYFTRVCLPFPSNSLSKISIRLENSNYQINCASCHVLECFCSKNWKRYNVSK